MAYRWPSGTVCKWIDLDVADRACPVCERCMHVCDHRYHHLWTLEGPTQVVNRLVRCPEPSCESRGHTFSPEAELSISMPRWCLGWDVLCWLGHRRFARHWSVPQLRAELQDTHQIRLSDDAITHYIGLYQTMLAARQQDPARLAEVYRDIVLARQWAERLGKPVRAWMSDKQDAFVKAIATEFPGIPHRYCQNHFVRDLAKPVLDMDSQAKVTMRSKVRGLRAIERRVLEERRPTAAPESPPPPALPTCAVPSQAALPASATPAKAATPEPCASSAGGLLQTESALEATRWATAEEPEIEDEAGEVVLGYGAAVRGILNDSQGGPLHPPGVRMSEALQDVRASLARNLGAKKGGLPSRC